MRPGSGGCDPALLLGALGYAAWRAGTTSYALSAAITLPASLLLLRAFVLMHECGHGSLFRSGRLNRGSGFALAVLNGMPLGVRIAAFEAPCWSSVQELRHMSWNNVAVLLLWGLAARLMMGPWPFVGFYIVAASLTGAAGLVLFSVQHNFEQSHASGNASWGHTRGAMEGTSFLCPPPWLNWITANIGYHHVHHLSARLPSYRLAKCHDEYAGFLRGVRRIRLGQVPAALMYILWDTANQRIVSVAELQRRGACHQSAVSRMEACCRHPAHSRLWRQLVMPACRVGCGSVLASPAFSGLRSRANGFCSAPSPRRHRPGWPRASAPRMGLSARGWPPAH